MRSEKEAVRTFYDTFGWRRTDADVFKDSEQFVDSRPVLDDYKRRTGRRVVRSLGSRGTYFLDAGSGALPQTALSSGFERHVCVDLSLTGLREARARVGDRGLFVVGDLVSLPFRDNAFDAILCAHVLYHVPADEQEAAIRELYRTLSGNGRCVIIYQHPRSVLERVARRRHVPDVPAIAGGLWSRVLRRGSGNDPAPDAREHPERRGTPERQRTSEHQGTSERPTRPFLYVHAHDPDWFRRILPASWRVDVRCFRAMGQGFTTRFVRENAMGRILTRAMAGLEEACPRFMLRVGTYLLVVIEKPGRLAGPAS